MSFKLPKEDTEYALQLWETKDQSAFELGRLVNTWVEDQAKYGVPAQEVYMAFSGACKGASMRTIRYYAEVTASYTMDDWEEYFALSFDHFARAAYLERNDHVTHATYALEWARRFAEKEGKGKFASADRMLAEFLHEEKMHLRELKRRKDPSRPCTTSCGWDFHQYVFLPDG